jgi:hypothetical protein
VECEIVHAGVGAVATSDIELAKSVDGTSWLSPGFWLPLAFICFSLSQGQSHAPVLTPMPRLFWTAIIISFGAPCGKPELKAAQTANVEIETYKYVLGAVAALMLPPSSPAPHTTF